MAADVNKKKKVLLVDQIGHKTYEYDYSACRYLINEYDMTCYMSDNTPRNVDTTGFRVEYGFHDVYSGNKIAKTIKYIRALSEMWAFIKENHFDIIHLQWYELALYQKFYIKALRRLCKPAPRIVMTVHGIMPWRNGFFRHFERQLAYLEADAILLHSEPALEQFNKCFRSKCPKYVITSAFRDEADYVPMDKREARRMLGLPEDKTIILSFGTIREDKTIDLLFKAFPQAYKKNPNLFLLSGGTLNVREKDYYKALAEKCRETGSARIDFDYIDKTLEPAYYSAADILVVPYSYISQSGVAYCGLLYNLPMIASDIPRLDLMAKKRINAEIFEKGSVEQLVRKILDLSADPEKMKRYSEGSKHLRESDFSIHRRVAMTKSAYRELFTR